MRAHRTVALRWIHLYAKKELLSVDDGRGFLDDCAMLSLLGAFKRCRVMDMHLKIQPENAAL